MMHSPLPSCHLYSFHWNNDIYWQNIVQLILWTQNNTAPAETEQWVSGYVLFSGTKTEREKKRWIWTCKMFSSSHSIPVRVKGEHLQKCTSENNWEFQQQICDTYLQTMLTVSPVHACCSFAFVGTLACRADEGFLWRVCGTLRSAAHVLIPTPDTHTYTRAHIHTHTHNDRLWLRWQTIGRHSVIVITYPLMFWF